jgi:hypothetical protein
MGRTHAETQTRKMKNMLDRSPGLFIARRIHFSRIQSYIRLYSSTACCTGRSTVSAESGDVARKFSYSLAQRNAKQKGRETELRHTLRKLATSLEFYVLLSLSKQS